MKNYGSQWEKMRNHKNIIGYLYNDHDEKLRNMLADLIMANHLVDFNSLKGVSNHCLREECTHVEDAMIVRGNA